MSFNGCLVKQMVGHPCCQRPLSNQMNKWLICATACVTFHRVMLHKKSQLEKVRSYVITLTSWNDRMTEMENGAPWRLPGVKEGKESEGDCHQDSMRDPWGDGSALCLHRIDVHVLVMTLSYRIIILSYSLVRCHPWGRLSKGHMGSFCVASYSCMWISNSFKIGILIKMQSLEKIGHTQASWKHSADWRSQSEKQTKKTCI